jgi:protein TonB
MILRTAGPGPAYHPQPSARPSRGAAAAIVISLLLHAIVGLYLYAHRFALTAAPHPPDEAVITIETVRLRPPPPPPPPTHDKRRQPPPQRAQQPIHIHQAPAILGLNPGPTIEVGSGTSGGGGGGLGLSQVTPQPAPAPPRPKVKTILNPDWISKPSGAQLAGAYPDRALDLGIAGSATLLCTVGVNGQVRDCKVAEEAPKDQGFGAAALKLSPYFRIRPETEDGEAVDGALVRVPLTFGVR